MTRSAVATTIAALALLATVPAQAAYPARGLTTNGGALDIYAGPVPRPLLQDAGLEFHTGGDDLDFDAGASFGITEQFELGAFLLETRLFEDTSVGNPYIWGTYQFIDGATEVGVRALVPIPIFDSEFWLGFAVPVVVRSGSVRFETGADMRFTFVDPLDARLFVPLRIVFGVTEALYLGFDTGVNVPITNGGGIGIPIGGFVGVEVAPKVDITAAVRWDGFFASSRDPVVSGENPQIGVGVNIYDLLL